jgi:hypothetical protein
MNIEKIESPSSSTPNCGMVELTKEAEDNKRYLNLPSLD